MNRFELIFDSAGGIQLQTENYCHHYWGREREAAQGIRAILDGQDPETDWDGNEPENRLTYEYEQERNGQYRWVTESDVLEVLGLSSSEARGTWLEENAQGFAERDFFRALFDLSQEPE